MCLINADGTGFQQLTYQTADTRPAWSPDGKRIAFSREVSKVGKSILNPSVLFEMKLDGAELTQLTDASITAEYPFWSPDSSQIIFSYSKDDYSTKGIGLVNADGTGLKLLTASGEVYPQWLPDGDHIAFVRIVADGIKTDSQIYTMSVNGFDQTQFFTRVSGLPTWSPDGTKIAITSNKSESFGIWVMNVGASDLVRLTDSGISPSWSPNGQYIVFYKSDPQCVLCPTSGQLWIMRADGSQQTKLTNGPVDQNPVWSPVP